MKIILAIILSIGLHIGAIYLFEHNTTKLYYNLKKSKQKKFSNIHYVKLKPKIIKKKKLIKYKKPKVIKKKKSKKKNISKPKLKIKPKIEKKAKKIINKLKKIKPKLKPKIIPKPKPKPLDKITKSYLDLYGDEFKKYPKATQIFIIKNIKDIGKITEIFLQYPMMSVQANQSGVSVVEFILNPNGTIKNLKIIKSSHYFLLDDNTMETINEAYSDYPRPPKPTVIRIYVKYKLY